MQIFCGIIFPSDIESALMLIMKLLCFKDKVRHNHLKNIKSLKFYI